MTKRKPRMCSRFYCDRRRDRFCCRDCPRIWSCDNACLNDPGRCGLEDRGQRIAAQNVSRITARGWKNRPEDE